MDDSKRMKNVDGDTNMPADRIDIGSGGSDDAGSSIINPMSCGPVFSILFEKTHEAVFFFLEDIIVDCNSRAVDLLGYDKQELIGVSPLAFVPEIQPDGSRSSDRYAELKELCLTGDTQTIDWQISRKDGVLLDTVVSLSSVTIDGKIMIVGIIHDVTAQHTTSRSLEELNEQYHAIFISVEEHIVVSDDNGYVLEANPAVCRLLGYNYDEFIGMHISEYVAHDSIAEFDVFRRNIQKTGSYSGIVKAMRKDGTFLDIELTGSGFKFRGKPCYLSVGRDITERLQSEQKLKDSQVKLALALNAASDGVWEWDIKRNIVKSVTGSNHLSADGDDGRYIDVNEWNKGMHPEDIDSAMTQINRHLKGLTPFFHNEFRQKTDSGMWVWVMSRGKTVEWDENGNPSKVIGIYSDITETKTTQIALVESEKRLRSIFDHAMDEILISKPETLEIIDANQASLEAMGYTIDELKTMSLTDIDPFFDKTVPSERRGSKDHLLKPFLFNGIHIRKDGTRYPVEVRIGETEWNGNVYLVGFARDVTEREKNRAALEESNRMLKLVLDTIPVRVFWKDTDLRYFGCNKLFAQDHGLSDSHDIIGKSDLELRWVAEVDSYRSDDTEVIRTGKAKLDFEEPQTTKKGMTRWLMTSKVPLHDFDGRIIGVLGAYQDITERKEMQLRLDDTRTELERRNNFLEGLMSSIPNPVFFMDINGTYLGCNRAYTEWTGKTFAEIKGKSFREVYPESQIDGRYEKFRKLVDHGGIAIHELKILNKDRELRDVIYSVGVFYDEQGEIAGLIGAYSDVTELKKAEADLRKSENMLDSIIKTVPDIIYRLDTHGVITFISESVSDYGYSPEELTGINILDIVHPDDRAIAQYHLNERRTGSRRTAAFEVRFIRKDREYVSFEVKSAKLKQDPVFVIDAEGLYNSEIHSPETFIGTQGIARDITERKRLQEQLNQAQKMESIGRLAGGVAHDFNNLLTVIAGNAQIALMQLSDTHPLYDYLDEVNKSTMRATDLTRQLLAFSRRQIVEPKVIDVNSIILDMEKMLKRLIGEDIDVRLLLSDNLWPVTMDPGQLEQVITNLAVNARDAMPDGGRLTVETSNITLNDEFIKLHTGAETGDFITIVVDDTGIGMDDDVKQHIFEPFFTTKEMGKGTGLGLSTCYGIVKQNGGSIWVYSERGEGTTFKIYLPRSVKAAVTHHAAEAVEPATGGSETILVVEDENSVRRMIIRVLRDNGYNVIEANDGLTAIETVKDSIASIDLLLTDVIMPRMGGRDLSENLKVLKPDLKTIYMSGYTDNSIVHRGVLDEGIKFISKPFNPSDILRKIRSVLDEKQ